MAALDGFSVNDGEGGMDPLGSDGEHQFRPSALGAVRSAPFKPPYIWEEYLLWTRRHMAPIAVRPMKQPQVDQPMLGTAHSGPLQLDLNGSRDTETAL
jgi:hypothetical protein